MNIPLPVDMVPLSGKAGSVVVVALIVLAIYLGAKNITLPAQTTSR
jgi:hypothetical protein